MNWKEKMYDLKASSPKREKEGIAGEGLKSSQKETKVFYWCWIEETTIYLTVSYNNQDPIDDLPYSPHNRGLPGALFFRLEQ